MPVPSTHTLVTIQRQMLLIEHEWRQQVVLEGEAQKTLEAVKGQYMNWPILPGSPLRDSLTVYQIMEELNLVYGFPQGGSYLFMATPTFDEWLTKVHAGTFVRDPLPETSFASLSTQLAEQPLRNGRIFVVHGEDVGSEDSIARAVCQFIRASFGYEPVMLDIGSKPGVVFDHFEEAAALCSAAVCIWTPDRDRLESGSIRPNVTLETGYFIAHLGLHRVIVIRHGGVTQAPSDLGGQTFLTESTWKSHLAERIHVAMAGLNPDTSSE